jgi:DNA-binding response OmpR family regulator
MKCVCARSSGGAHRRRAFRVPSPPALSGGHGAGAHRSDATMKRVSGSDVQLQPAVLVVEDDSDIRTLLCDLLAARQYSPFEASEGRGALRVFHERRPDLVLLDLGLPGLDGWETLRRIRDISEVPILVLTARSAEGDKVRALRAGADDYVVKPFSYEELLARLAALLRRAGRDDEPISERYDDGYLAIDYATREVTVNCQPVRLTPLEFRLLTTLIRHPRQVLSREQLLRLVWDDPYGVSRDAVRLYIGYVRRKLGSGAPIETVRGFGYRYLPPAPKPRPSRRA